MKQPDDTFELPSVKLLVSRETGILGPNLLRTEKSLFHVKPLPQDLADELFHVEHVTEPAHHDRVPFESWGVRMKGRSNRTKRHSPTR